MMKPMLDTMTRTTKSALQTARLATVPPRAEALSEVAELAKASTERFLLLQKSWAEEWGAWLTYAGSLSGADTLPKVMERSANIALQAQAQVMSQVTDTMGLMENISVSYSYWVAKQFEESGKEEGWLPRIIG